MMRNVSPTATVSAKIRDGVPFQAWTTWRALGFNNEDRLVVVDFDFDEDGFDVELETEDFREGGVQALIVFDGQKATVQLNPDTFDSRATRISARDIGCGDDDCEGCISVGVPVELEIVEDLVEPHMATSDDTDAT